MASKKRILIVDDNALNRQLLSFVLMEEYDIIEAANGLEALGVIEREYRKLSAVLLDIVMPEMDGYELVRILRSNAVYAQLPVIMITGSEDEESRVKALSLGANDFMLKPFNPDIVKHCLKNNIALFETSLMVDSVQKDRLTGLYNREFFFDKADSLIAAQKDGFYMMACMDVDNFKLVNDQYGTREGDRILMHISAELLAVVEKLGGVAGRISGDNFACLYPASAGSEEAMREALSSRFLPKGAPQSLSLSVGLCIASDTSLSADAIYDRAFIAKRSVKGRFDTQIAYFDESMLSELLREQEITGDMRAALSSHQFEVWYQPQYIHTTGALAGAEALVRWRHPAHGLVSPVEFIPVFEENGFVYELDKYVWEEALRALRSWLDRGLSPVPVSVNVSRYDILRSDLVAIITGLVEKYSVPVELLRLEVTESAFSESTEGVISVVKELISLGFTVEIDDFGSGYSSLNTLKDVPAQIVKLDMKFLENESGSGRGGSIVESIVRMTKWLGMSVIAEGVETLMQADFLSSVGCTLVQGYLYSRPVPREEYEALLISSKKTPGLETVKSVVDLDGNRFWNPESMDTLIFNSYCGAACIFEYRGGKVELLRANDKYMRMIGAAGLTMEDAMRLDWTKHLRPSTIRDIANHLSTSLATNSDVSSEFSFIDLPGCPHEVFMRSVFRVIATVDDRFLVYSMHENISALHESERQRESQAKQFETILASIDCGVSATVRRNGKKEYIYANERYFEMLGVTSAEYSDRFEGSWLFIHPDDRAYVEARVEEGERTREPYTMEFRVVRTTGEVAWHSVSVNVLSLPDIELPVSLSVVTDITREREEGTRAREGYAQIEAILSNVHNGIIVSSQSGREYKPLYSNDRILEVFGCTRDMLQKGMDYIISQVFPKDGERFALALRETAETGEPRFIEEINAVRADGVKKVLRVWISMIDLPGVEGRARISVYSDITGIKAQEREIRELTKKVQSDNETLTNLMNEMPGGLARMRLLENGEIRPVYFSHGFEELVGMTNEELLKLSEGSAFAGVHPDDMQKLAYAMREGLRRGTMSNVRYRLRRHDGSYIWVLVFARLSEETNGDRYISIFYIDARDIMKSESRQKSILDNIPSGAGLFEYDGKNLRIIHLNRRYWKLVSRENSEPPTDTAFFSKNIHPDDRETLSREISSAVRQGREMRCDARIRSSASEDGFLPFHITGNIVPEANGRYLIYTNFEPIADGSMSYQQMLPIALATLMDSSNGYAFFKGADLHYLSANSAYAALAELDDERDIVGKTDRDIFNESLANIYIKDDRTVLETGEPILGKVFEMRKKSGANIYVSLSRYALRDSSNNVIGIYGAGRDVTEYRDTADRLKLLTESIAGGIASVEVSNERIRTLYFNDGFYLYSGYSRAEFVRLSEGDALFLVFDEDRHVLKEALGDLLKGSSTAKCTYRCRTKNGGYRCFSMTGTVAGVGEGRINVNLVQYDITAEREYEEKLRRSEEENRLAIAQSGNIICRYDVAERTLTMPKSSADSLGISEIEYDVPHSIVRQGLIATESEKAYIGFFESMIDGKDKGEAVFHAKLPDGWRWVRAYFSTIFTDTKKPVNAVISFVDVTDQVEKESIYVKWKQSIQDKKPGSYTLFRCNLSKDSSFDKVEGTLLSVSFNEKRQRFSDRSREFAESCVFIEDRDAYLKFVNADAMLASYYRGKRYGTLEFRDCLAGGGTRWLRLTVELVEYPNSSEVEAYLMYDDIDEEKRAQLKTKELAETDALTGVFNRAKFIAETNALLRRAESDVMGALLMLDIDGFKNVNDVFGHNVGDLALIDIAKSLRSVLRKDDLLGRIGGDEFVVFLNDIPDITVAESRARAIGRLVKRSFSHDVEISVSIGIAISPRDGDTYDVLYDKADKAMYYIKERGKGNFAVYNESGVYDCESERLRMRNMREEMKNADSAKLRMMLQKNGVAVIEHNWVTGAFEYERGIGEILFGVYDGRSFWHILLSDVVAEAMTVMSMQKLALSTAQNTSENESGMKVRLKRPDKAFHWFDFRIFKQRNDFGVTEKLIYTLRDIGGGEPEEE